MYELFLSFLISYREKAAIDLKTVKQRVKNLLQELNLPLDSIPEDVVELYCKNAGTVKVIRYRTLREEYTETPRTEKIGKKEKGWKYQKE